MQKKTIPQQESTLKSLKKKFTFKSKYGSRKFICISLIIFFTVYIFTVLRGLEYSILVPKLGAEIISAIELCCLLPASSFFVVLYFKLGKHFSRINIAQMLLVSFIVFFYIFNLFVFPFHENLIFNLSTYKDQYPRLKYPIMLVENWDITLFYVISELWGIMMLNLSFWQMANEISTVSEAKKFYGFFGALGQSGNIAGGWAAVKIGKFYPTTLDDAWILRFDWLLNSVTLSGIVLLICYWWIAKNVWPYVRIEERKSIKIKLSLKESFRYIFTSRYLRLVSTLIICYGVLISISETLWKDQVNKLHTNSADYSAFMGKYQMYLGIGAVTGSLVGVATLKRFSWLFNALSTPMCFLFGGVIFLSLITFRESLEPVFDFFGIPVIVASVTAGMYQIILAKSFKYSLFDLSKEVTFIPLDEELRTNGKAAVDIISNRIGRSGGSVIILTLLTLMPSSNLLSLSGYLFIVFLSFLVLWLYAAIALNTEFEKVARENQSS